MDKILIIGQAPPAGVQKHPYDTTMLYDWLSEIGISKDRAQQIFTFDAMIGHFPGFDSNGGHLRPAKHEMDRYYAEVLDEKINSHKKVIMLGNVPKEYFKWAWPTLVNDPNRCLCLIHPSKRNYSLYLKNKASIIDSLRVFIGNNLQTPD